MASQSAPRQELLTDIGWLSEKLDIEYHDATHMCLEEVELGMKGEGGRTHRRGIDVEHQVGYAHQKAAVSGIHDVSDQEVEQRQQSVRIPPTYSKPRLSSFLSLNEEGREEP